MPLARSQSARWISTARHFLLDGVLCVIGFWAAAALRFSNLTPEELGYYATTVLVAALMLPASCYVLGLYAPMYRRRSLRYRVTLLMVALIVMTVAILAKGSLDFSSRVGRGVLVIGVLLTGGATFLHHFLLRRLLTSMPERLAFVVGCAEDEAMASAFVKLSPRAMIVAGMFVKKGFKPRSSIPVLGTWSELEADVASQDIREVLCTEEHLTDPSLARALRVLRYEGLRVGTLAHAFEECYQMVPLELVTDAWLLHAASHPEVVYIRKFKRAFDICASLGLLMVLGPVCFVGIVLSWFSSGRPLFFRQVRCGRLGKPFEIFKLRTMRMDAERDGAQWSSVKGDKRVTAVGRLLRMFRVDEIPQLWNILRGDMSFVGPRPERPEFVKELAEKVPYYMERMLVPPGLTGWAQVNYPYASSIEDARHKLEYDLYYLKHMGLLLDLFVLLDTVKTVLQGGATLRFPERRDVTAHLREVLQMESRA